MTITTRTARGSAPICPATEIPIGHNKSVKVVFSINCVKTQDKANNVAVTISGLGLPPMTPTTVSAINRPAPLLSSASATGIIPAKRKIASQSTPATACFSVRHPAAPQGIGNHADPPGKQAECHVDDIWMYMQSVAYQFYNHFPLFKSGPYDPRLPVMDRRHGIKQMGHMGSAGPERPHRLFIICLRVRQ